jgi:hypothetical protein
MSYAVVPTAVTGDIIPASYGNILRDNDAAFKAVLDGSAQAFGSAFYPTTDANLNLQMSGGNPLLVVDTNDYLRFTRSTNLLEWLIASAVKFSVASDGTVTVAGDANFNLQVFGSEPYIILDSGDYLRYLRSTNTLGFYVGSAQKLACDANGKLTGAGFYDSGEVAVTNGSAITVSHGLSARPRFVKIYKATASGTADSKTIPDSPAIATVSNTQIITSNNADGATRYCNLYAMQ